MKQTAEKLAAQITGAVRTNEPLSRHTSFKIGGPADLFIEPETIAELVSVLTTLRQEGIPYFMLGNGTNLLVGDRGYRGAVIRLAGEFLCASFTGSNVQAGAGVLLARLAREACDRGLAGLEFAAGIPGTVGGALVMNAGAHGAAFGDVLADADILDGDLKLHTVPSGDLGLSYRKSQLSPDSVVCGVRLTLTAGDREKQARICREHLRFRQERQPRQPNAGSIFKNPPHDSAGRLIEAAGYKGRRAGGAMVSDLHANFIINSGDATAADVLALMDAVRTAVLQQFGINLEPEIRLLGD